MHLRCSRAIGTPVVEEESLHLLGTVAGILLQPDTGKIEGVFVRIRGFLSSRELFLPTVDILRWGERVSVAHAEILAPLEDHVRLYALAQEGRPILGQPIRTETGNVIGTCADVQFDTQSFRIEWLFPKSLWKWGIPIAVSHIIEVRRDAIVVRDPATPATEKVGVPLLNQMEAA